MYVSGNFDDIIRACKFEKKVCYNTRQNLNLVCEINGNELKILTAK